MARDAWLTHLAQVPMFAHCSKKELQQVAQATMEVSAPDGRVLAREGEPGHECFIVIEGEATVARKGEVVATIGPADVVGELAPLTGGQRTATVTAKGPVTLLVIGQREFAALLDEIPGFANRILHDLAKRYVELDERVNS
ncbi:MAG: cyclic nucleotide-binding domain-containing protein [Acidimicrobiales bacterium]|jgi:CRP-like cAMP-binding protein|nr:cyclic nucleotide-binding domain-containing protein [Acidimicrobiales bacterium]